MDQEYLAAISVALIAQAAKNAAIIAQDSVEELIQANIEKTKTLEAWNILVPMENPEP